MRFDLPKAQHVTASVVNGAGEVVRTFADDKYLRKGTHPFVWNGRTDAGAVVPSAAGECSTVGCADEVDMGSSVHDPE